MEMREMTAPKRSSYSTIRVKTSILHDAASANDTGQIERLLTLAFSLSKRLSAFKKINSNCSLTKLLLNMIRNESGQTPLHVAVENNCYESVIMLTREGCDIDSQDDEGNTPLHIAERNNFDRILTYIFNLPFIKDVRNKNGETALHIAAINWTDDILQKNNIVTHMRKMSASILNVDGYSPFHLAIKLDKRTVVEIMLGEQPQLLHLPTVNGEPPLWVALKYGHLDMMLLLLKNGCDINRKNTKIGAPPIWLAIYRQNKKAMDLLLESPGFDIGTVNEPTIDGISPLLLAMIKGDETQVDQLFNVSTDNDEWETLALKVKYGLAIDSDFEKVRNHATMLGRTDDQGNTLLHLAVMSDNLEMVAGVIAAGGARNSENVINIARERLSMDVLYFLTNTISQGWKMYSVTKNFPRFNDNFEELFDPLKKAAANRPWLEAEPNGKDQISYLDLKKYVLPKVNIEWSDIKKVKGGGIPTISHLSNMKRRHGCDDRSTSMIRDFINILINIEIYLREEDELFKHLGVILLPVGSIVEGTKVGRLNELDVMFFCSELHGFLSVKDERTICISMNRFQNLPMIVQDLFNLRTGAFDLAKFFALFMQSIKKAMQDIVDKENVPKTVELFLDVVKCAETDCEANGGKEWCQCSHKEPPCVCYTAVGACLNFVWKGKENMDMVFTIDIVPNFYVDLNEHSNLSNFNLRQKLIRYLMNHKPFGWVEFLKKYIRDDRIYMGQFDLEQRKIASVGIKMINPRGDFVIRPGMNMHVQSMLEDKVVHDTYCLLKVLKELTASKVKSFDLKKAISDQLKTSTGPRDAFSFAKLILNSPDLKGKFDGLCQQYLDKYYLKIDLEDFPAKNSLSLALQLISTYAMKFVGHIKEGNLEKFRQLLETTEGTCVKNMRVNGKSLLHFAATSLNREIIEDLLLAGCDVNLQNLSGNTALYSFLYVSMMSEMSNKNVLKKEALRSHDILGIVQHLTSSDDVRLELQNRVGETVFHLLARTNQDSKVMNFLLSKVSKQELDLRNHDGRTALMLACLKKGMDDMAINMVTRGASGDIKDNLGLTALHYASQTSSCIILDLLLTQGANVEEKDHKGLTPLMYACVKENSHKSAKLLLKWGAKVNESDNEGNTALYYATINGNLDIVCILVQSGADVEKAGALDTQLKVALKYEYMDILDFLLKNGANVNGEVSCIPHLHYAAHKGLLTAAQLLLENGAEVNREHCKTGTTPLYIASQYGHLELVALFLKNDAFVNIAIREDGMTPLFIASQEGHLEVVRLLLGSGADVDLAIDNGNTPLIMASGNGHLEVVELLLKSGAKVNKVSVMNGTPLAAAASKGHADIVTLLLNNKADMNIAINDEFTPLHFACNYGHLPVVKILIEKAGAVIDSNCIKYALNENHGDIVEYLRKEIGGNE